MVGHYCPVDKLVKSLPFEGSIYGFEAYRDNILCFRIIGSSPDFDSGGLITLGLGSSPRGTTLKNNEMICTEK